MQTRRLRDRRSKDGVLSAAPPARPAEAAVLPDADIWDSRRKQSQDVRCFYRIIILKSA